MQIAVIGHGPSVEGKGMGREIDSHDVVIRLKKGWQLIRKNPEDYGQKLDVLIASTETLGCLLIEDEEIASGVQEYVGYPKNGWFVEAQAIEIGKKLKSPFIIPLNFFNFWNYRFRQMNPAHPNISLGCAAALFAQEYFEFPIVHLYGFDSIVRPDQDFARITSIPRTGTGAFPDHDWEKEKALLQAILCINARNENYVQSECRLQ